MTMTMDRPRTVDELRAHREELYDQLDALGDALSDEQWQTILAGVAAHEARDIDERLKLHLVCAYLAWAANYPSRVGKGELRDGGCRCGSRRGSGMVEPLDKPDEWEPCGTCNPAAYERARSRNRATGKSHLHCRNPERCDGCQEAIEIAEQRTQLPV